MNCLIFEVKSIQDFIFASGKLRDIVGASELIDLLTNDNAKGCLLNAVLDSCQAKEQIKFSRRAGGAFYAFCGDADLLRRFNALWTVAVQQWAPRLGYVEGLAAGADHNEAFEAARKASREQNSKPIPYLPLASPLAERSRRTGHVATTVDRRDGAPIDAAVARQKAFADLSQAEFLRRYSYTDNERVTWKDWPRNLEPGEDGAMEFPQGLQQSVGVIYADGNGMGQVLLNIGEAAKRKPQKSLDLYLNFSAAIDASTRFAASQATSSVLLPARQREQSRLLAARPILLGGDDVCVLVRADLALDYVDCFAAAFEEESRRQLRSLADSGVKDLPNHMTMGFGIAFVSTSQPFASAAKLAESLMAHAKTRGKEYAKTAAINQGSTQVKQVPPSTVAFYRATSEVGEDYAEIVDTILTHTEDVAASGDANVPRVLRYVHTLGAYGLGAPRPGLPALHDLRKLLALLQDKDMARGPLRGFLNLMQIDPAQARTAWRRWRKLMQERKSTQDKLKSFDDALRALLPGYDHSDNGPGVPYAHRPGDQQANQYSSPLGDVLELKFLSPGTQTEETRA